MCVCVCVCFSLADIHTLLAEKRKSGISYKVTGLQCMAVVSARIQMGPCQGKKETSHLFTQAYGTQI